MVDRYAFDAMIMINRHTPLDIYVSLWGQVEALGVTHRLCTPRQVYEEVARSDDYCAPWAKAQTGFIVEADDEEVTLVYPITAAHPDWVQDQRNGAGPLAHRSRRQQEADPRHREGRRGRGVTDNNLGIPNVADEHGDTCIGFNELV